MLRDRFVSFSVVMLVTLPFLLGLQNAARQEYVPFYAHIVLVLHIACFTLCIPALRLAFHGAQLTALALWLGLWTLVLVSGMPSAHAGLVLQRGIMIFLPGFILLTIAFSDARPLSTFFRIMKFMAWFGAGLAFVGLLLFAFGSMRSTIGLGTINSLAIGPLSLEQRIYGTPPLFRISSLTGNPNALGALLLMSLLATAACYVAGLLRKFTMLLLMLVQAAGLLLTFSRNSIGIAVASLTMFAVLAAGRWEPRFVRAAGAGMAMVLMGFLAFNFMPPAATAMVEVRVGQGLNVRHELWRPLIASVAERPLLGVGFGVSGESILSHTNHEHSAHNAHLATLAEVGFIGYLVLAAFWGLGAYIGLRNGSRPSTDQTRIAYITIGILLIGLFFHQGFEASILRFGARHFLWLYLVAAAVAIYHNERKQSARAVAGATT
jgi:O-antigen ligase